MRLHCWVVQCRFCSFMKTDSSKKNLERKQPRSCYINQLGDSINIMCHIQQWLISTRSTLVAVRQTRHMSLSRGVINGTNTLLSHIFVNTWTGHLFYIALFSGSLFSRDKTSFARKIPRGMEGHQGGGEADGEGWRILHRRKEGGVGER